MAESFDPQQRAEFDRYAHSYKEMHSDVVRASGEAPEYFAEYKRDCLLRVLGEQFGDPVLDYGCGIGNLASLLAEKLTTVHGYDPSSESVKVAAQRAPKVRFFSEPSGLPKDHYGAIVLANVLHHVEPKDRPALVASLVPLLKPGGRIVVFEHNPYNPLTRRVVAACAFDDNAVLLPSREIVELFSGAGLTKIRRDFIVFFPRALSWLRSLEPHMHWLPMGAQVCAWGVREGKGSA